MVVTDVAGWMSIYFHPEALPAFSEIAQKLPSTSFIPENLFPSISARHDVMDGTGKFNPRRSCHSSLQSRQSHKPTADPNGAKISNRVARGSAVNGTKRRTISMHDAPEPRA
jgi:hypothetical protein